MKLLLADLPETHELTVEWLERQLVGMELSQLVTELAAVHNATRPFETVRTVLGNDTVDRLLRRGLKELAQEQLRKVMIQPFHLFELQELVFAHGGEYWRRKESELDLKQRVEADWRKLKAKLPVPTPLPPPPVPVPSGGNAWLVGSAMGLLLGAIAGFISCYLWLNGPTFPPKAQQVPPSVPPSATNSVWGWNKPDTVAAAESPQAYLNRLASLLEEWKTVVPLENVPNRKSQLLIRLLELRAGCTRLSIAEHPLPVEQRRQLQAKAVQLCGEIDVLTTNTQQVDDPTAVMPFIDRFISKVAGDLRMGRLSLDP